MSDTLVLNSYWEPVARLPWQRAVTLLWESRQAELDKRNYKLKIELIEEYEDWVVHSASKEWRVPSVIRWIKSTPRRKKAIKFSRENIYLRDGGKCQYCGTSLSRDKKDPDCFTYDHILPRDKGGQTNWTNVVTCCIPCNQRKSNKLLAEVGMRLLKVPVKPSKLTESLRLQVHWHPSMPSGWKAYIRNDLYWNDELMNNNK